MQSMVQLGSREVAAAARPKGSSRTSSIFRVLRRIARLDFFSLEDEMARAIDRAFAEFAREIRK
jgi:hypothetical protein